MKPESLTARVPAMLATALLAASLLACTTGPTPQAAAPRTSAWKLDNDASELRFVTTKNTNVAEVQQFKRLSGEVAPSGAVKLVIDLTSVETQIPLRNERMQTLLFDTARFPTAQFEGAIDMSRLKSLEPGASVDFDVAGKLAMRGQAQDTQAALRVVVLRGDRLLVTTRAPILVNASKFDLSPGIEKLREVMGLPNIIGTVPVSFALDFQRQA